MQLAQILPRRLRTFTHELAKFANTGVNSLNRVLPKRFHGVSDEVVKFGLIGVIGLVVNLGVFNLLLRTVLDDGEVKAKAIATVVATTWAYFLNRHWTYRHRPKSAMRREYTLFLFFNAVGLIIEAAVVWIAKYGLHQNSDLVFNICSGIGIVLGTIFRFWAYRNHVFKLGEDVDEEPALVSAAAALATVPDPALLDEPVHPSPANGKANAQATAPANGKANGKTNGKANAQATAPANGKANGKTNGKANGKKRGPNGVHTADDVLQAELTQIELDNIVAGEQSRTRRT